MKTFARLFVAAVLLSSCIIQRIPHKPAPISMPSLTGREQEAIRLISEFPTDSTIKLYIGDEYSMDSLFRLSKKRYTVFYLGMSYCQEQFFHRIARYVEQHNEYFDFIPMFTFGNGAGYTYDFLRWEQYYRPTFVPDSTVYKEKFFDATVGVDETIRRICPECDVDKMGASAFFVFERGEYLFHTDYTMDDFTCIEMIESLPLE